jgi:hypothetical protein
LANPLPKARSLSRDEDDELVKEKMLRLLLLRRFLLAEEAVKKEPKPLADFLAFFEISTKDDSEEEDFLRLDLRGDRLRLRL